MMQNIRKYYGVAASAAAIIILLIAEGCASIGNPSGGPRDEQPPRFVSSDPAPGTVGLPVDIERIRLTFDELINVKDAFTKVIVSPPGRSVPRVSSLGHRVNVQFNDSLEPNTTYTIDFADAIEDNNEGNRLENFAYTFSTGAALDSLRIAGRVLSARALEPMQVKIVGVHRLPDDTYAGTASDTAAIASSPLNFLESVNRKLFAEKFYRVARTDDRGRFSIEGLPAGRYRVYALDDTNSDYLFTNPDEEVGFYDVVVSPSTEETITVDSIFNLKTGVLDTVKERRRTIYLPNDIVIRSFPTTRKQQFVAKYERVDTTRLNLIFNAPMLRMPEISVVEFPEARDWAFVERSVGNDTLSFWLRDRRMIDADTLHLALKYNVLDSVQYYVEKADTLRFTADRLKMRSDAEKARKEWIKKALKERKKTSKNSDKANKGEATEEDEIEIKLPETFMKITITGAPSKNPRLPMIIETAEPIASINPDGVRLQQKVDTLWQTVEIGELTSDSLNPRIRYLRPERWVPDSEYKLEIDSLAIESIYGLRNNTETYNLRIKSEKEYSSLMLRLTDWPAGLPGIVELLNQSDAVVDIAPVNNGIIRFDYLTPGKYYARIFTDYNDNGQWDSGDPLTGLQPETVFYYPKALNIKANWNKEESWAVFATPLDRQKPETLLKNRPTPPRSDRSGRTHTATPDDDEE